MEIKCVVCGDEECLEGFCNNCKRCWKCMDLNCKQHRRKVASNVQKGNFEPCGKQTSFFDEVLNMKIDYMCGGEDGLCKECQKKYDSPNLNKELSE